MHIDWFFGPDGHGFVLDSEGQPQSSVATPFHGIVGLGLRDLLFREGVPPDAWVNNAHLIFDEQVERAVTAELAMLRAYADECEALSFGDSAVAVRTYLEERWGDLAARAEAWNVKEGHTSSVWNVMLDEQAEEPREFALNIGRDKAAGAELAATSGRMREIKARCSDIKMAAVLDIRSVRLMRRRGTVDVVVTQNEWVGDSCEIHALGNGGPSSGQYLLVDRFLTSDVVPARILSVYGRRCTDDERTQIERDLARFRHVACAAGVDAPVVDLTHGDAVWDGSGAVVVAVS